MKVHIVTIKSNFLEIKMQGVASTYIKALELAKILAQQVENQHYEEDAVTIGAPYPKLWNIYEFEGMPEYRCLTFFAKIVEMELYE